MPSQTTSTKNKRMYPIGTFRARPRRPDLTMKTITDVAYAVTRQKYKNHDRDFIRFIKALFADYIHEVTEGLLEGKVFHMPMKLGKILIIKKKSTTALDILSTIRLKRKVYYKNYHSDGYVMNFKWKKRGEANFHNMSFYVFKPVRPFKKRLLHKIKNLGFTEYALHTIKNRSRRLYDKHGQER